MYLNRNLSILKITELKSISDVTTSYPFVERMIGNIRRECLDQILFFNKRDLQRKLDDFQNYYNSTKADSSLDSETPNETTVFTEKANISLPSITKIRWQKHNNGLSIFPII